MPKKRKPYNKSTGRDYTYDKKYQASEEQKKNRAARNAARAKLMREGRVRKGDNKDVAHKNGNPRMNGASNLAVQSQKTNRGKAGEGGRKKGRKHRRGK